MTTNLCGSVPTVGAPVGSLCNVGYGFWLVNNKLAMAGSQDGTRAAVAAESIRLDCDTGEYWVEVAETCRAFMGGNTDVIDSLELVNGENQVSSTTTAAMENPFYADALVQVQHEFGFDFAYSDSDYLFCRGDVNISGAGERLDGGGTTGQFINWSYDGSAKTETDELARVYVTGSFAITYVVPPGASFTVNQLAVLAPVAVRPLRPIFGFSNGMKVNIFARKV